MFSYDQKNLGFYLFCKSAWLADLDFREACLGAHLRWLCIYKLHTHVTCLYASKPLSYLLGCQEENLCIMMILYQVKILKPLLTLGVCSLLPCLDSKFNVSKFHVLGVCLKADVETSNH